MQTRNGIEISDEDAIEYDRLIDLSNYYDRLQYVYKIKLNSLYGALTNFYFRFFDLRLGQSTTGTGRAILDHMGAQTALLLDGEYDINSESIAYGDSVAGDSVLYHENNTNILIQDMFESLDQTIGFKEYHYPTKMKVLTYDENTNESCYRPVKYVMRHRASKQMYRVWTTNDTYIDVTEDHSLMGYVNTKIRKKGESFLREITPEDFGNDINRLIYIKHRPRNTIDSKHLPDLMYDLLGLIVGDGGCNNRQSGIELSLGSKDKSEIIDKVLNPLIELGLATSITHMKNGHDIRLIGTKLWDKCRGLLYEDNVKIVPSWLRTETPSNIAGFLRGYFTADGGVTGQAVRLTSTVKSNIINVQELLTYCGISSNYFTETTENSFNGIFSGTHSTNLIIKSKTQFREKVGFILSRKQNAIPKSGKKDQYFTNLDFDLTGVVKIEKINYDDYVYDVEIDDTHTFFANNILVHNTDSIYFKTNAAVGMEGATQEELIDRAVLIADYIGKAADESFNEFCKKAFCIQPEFENIIACDREVVAKRGIFVTKKRYVLKLVDLDGYRVNKLKAMGLEMKKTTTPKIIQKFLEDVVNMILDGEASWDEIEDFIIGYRSQVTETLPPFEIGLPKGVRNVEKYTKFHEAGVDDDGNKPRLPGHVAASIHYNECLSRFNDKDSVPIISGTKIKIFYLTQKYGRFKSIAVPTDAGTMPSWFEQNFTVHRGMHEERLIDKNLEKIFTAIDRLVPTAQSRLNNSLMVF